MRFVTLRSFTYAILVHLLIGGLLVFSFDRMASVRVKPKAEDNIIAATTVDNQAVERELRRLKELEQEKQQRMERKITELQQQTRQAEEKREAEQRRLAELKKQERELAERRAEEERVWKQKQAAEARRREEEKRRQEALKKKQAEEALQRQLAAERAAEQRREDKKLQGDIIAAISRRVNYNFNKTGLPGGLECVLSVRTVPGGEVVGVAVRQSSGNEVFDRRAVTAVEKSSPLPIPANPQTYNRLNLRNFNFRFKPESGKKPGA